MSKKSTADSSKSSTSSKVAKPAKAAKKVAAKKTPATKAAKKVATKVVKKVATKVAKKAATKVAKKAVTKKVATKTAKSTVAEVKAPAPAPPAPAIIQARPIEPIAAPRPIEAPVFTPPPAAHSAQYANQHSAPPSENNDGPRIGRVPGGGPTQQHHHHQSPREGNNDSSQQRESRSKKRRDKRKRRREQFGENGNRNGNENPQRHERNDRNERNDRPPIEDRSATVLTGPMVEAGGIIEMTPKGYAFLRLASTNYDQAKDDIYISSELIRKHSLRHAQWIQGTYQNSNRGPQLVEITSVNGQSPDDAAKLPHFDELTAINPNKRIAFETVADRYTTRVVDIVAPVGRGQRGLIVSPPRSGKTTLLLHMAEAIREKYDEQIHLMILLVDERPEEVTEFRRALPGAEIYASSNDEASRNHTRIAELAIERAKRLVEAGKDVFLLMDSITRLARAYNGAMSSGKGGRNRATGSGGITIGALEVPRRLFAAARNTREAGSLTILATALIQTNSRADEAIFMEFKGTGNMELVLDRKIAESYVYPAVDIFKSGTRREELLLAEHMLHKIHLIRRGLSGHRPYEAMERLLYFVKKFPNNPQMLLEIKG
jgi:transcription termination factor Rho